MEHCPMNNELQRAKVNRHLSFEVLSLHLVLVLVLFCRFTSGSVERY